MQLVCFLDLQNFWYLESGNKCAHLEFGEEFWRAFGVPGRNLALVMGTSVLPRVVYSVSGFLRADLDGRTPAPACLLPLGSRKE